MPLIEEIEAVKNNPDLSLDAKKKAIRKLRRKARVPKEKDESPREDLISSILEAATALPLFDPKKEGGYAFSLRAATRIPEADFKTLKHTFAKRLGYEPKVHAVIVLEWDTLLLLGPVKS